MRHSRDLRTPRLRCGVARVVASATLLAAITSPLLAQCPNGSPPPCKSGSAAVRSPAVALNPRAWIVAPFSNATKSAELEWLRDAAVNLLTLDLGRWTDITVIDEKRVGDLMRGLSTPGRQGSPLTLNDGFALARRAGAANLVMGDFYKVGSGARFVVNVYDVKSGARVRTVTQQAATQDSLLPAFGPMARSVLALAPPDDQQLGVVGTTRIDAYREYLNGVLALHRFKTEESIAFFKRALTLDSTFALAHYQLALAFAWSETGGSAEGVAHAADAKRLGRALPVRERTLINTLVPFMRGDYSGSCTAIAPLAERDSTDVQVLYQYSECLFHDQLITPGAVDSLPGTFKGSWNRAMRALTTVIELDPTMHLAYDHLVYLLSQTERRGFVPGPSGGFRFAMLIRSGDTLEMQAFRRDSAHARQWEAIEARARSTGSANLNLARALTYALQWVESDPKSPQARVAVASVLTKRGETEDAYRQLRAVVVNAVPSNVQVLDAAWALAAKTGRGAEARAWFDSVVKVQSVDRESVPPYYWEVDFVFGRTKRFVTASVLAIPDTSPTLRAAREYRRELPFVMLGVPRASLSSAESAFAAAVPVSARCDSACLGRRLWQVHGYAMRAPRTPPVFYAKGAQYSLAFANDTAALRRAAVQGEQTARERLRTAPPVSYRDELAFIADYYLILRDSVAALRVARLAVDTVLMRMDLGFQGELSTAGTGAATSARPAVLLPRMMLLRADLAAKLGYPAEARRWYTQLLDLWVDADVELQPTVQRVRAALAGLAPGQRF